MLDPTDLYEIDEGVAARLGVHEGGTGPVLLHALEGFVDAGRTAELVSDHLVEAFETERLVTFDSDELHDYRGRRPLMDYDEDRWASYTAPRLVVDVARDAEGTAFLVLHGSEPDLRWERVAAGLQQVVDRFGVSLVVGVQGIPMATPHTRPVGASVSATRSELVGVQPRIFGKVRVPASFGAMLERRLGESGHDALGLTMHVPHYLAQGHFAPAALEAVRRVEHVTGLSLRAHDLEEAAHDAAEEIAERASGSDEVREVVADLERRYDAFVEANGGANLLAQPVEIPSADEIGAAFEEFLAAQDEPADGARPDED